MHSHSITPPSRQSSGGSAISSIAEEGESAPSIVYPVSVSPRRQNSYVLIEPQEMDEADRDSRDRDDTHSVLSRSSTTRTLVSPYQPRTSKEYTYGYSATLKDRPAYLSDAGHKSLPVLPKLLADEDEFEDTTHRVVLRSDLVLALGEDTLQHTTEIDSIPCAGVRISNGTLKGLMAWRLVVRIGGKEGMFPKHEVSPHPLTGTKEHFKSTSSPGKISFSSFSDSLEDQNHHVHTFKHLSSPSPTPPAGYNAVTTNFILDTSHSTSCIPQETLLALGFKAHSLHPGKAVLLRVQGIESRFLIGRRGEAGRLGVQFLEDANVSLVIDREVGPVLYGEISQLKDVPRTIRFSLQQRVRSLLGMNKLS